MWIIYDFFHYITSNKQHLLAQTKPPSSYSGRRFLLTDLLYHMDILKFETHILFLQINIPTSSETNFVSTTSLFNQHISCTSIAPIKKHYNVPSNLRGFRI